MKFGWRKAGDNSYQIGRWAVRKTWEADTWDVYFDGDLKAEGVKDAVEAMAEAEKMMDK